MNLTKSTWRETGTVKLTIKSVNSTICSHSVSPKDFIKEIVKVLTAGRWGTLSDFAIWQDATLVYRFRQCVLEGHENSYFIENMDGDVKAQFLRSPKGFLKEIG